MNHWKETAEILSRLAELQAAGERAALATVVRVVGSAYRRPGAKLLLEAKGGTLGSVSGGCLEADVREVAQAVLESGAPCLRHYATGPDEDMVWGLGLGCNGLVEVFVQPATEGSFAALAGRLRGLCAGDAPFALATVVEGGEDLGASLAIEAAGAAGGSSLTRSLADGSLAVESPAGGSAPIGSLAGGSAPIETLASGSGSIGSLAEGSLGPDFTRQLAERAQGLMAEGRSRVHQVGERGVFIEVLTPPPHLIVCGAGDDARPLVAYAADAGFRVTVVDHRPGLLQPHWFPQAARLLLARPDEPEIALPAAGHSLAVVMNHSLVHDREWVRRLLAAGLPYVGVLGPRQRTKRILGEIGATATGSACGAERSGTDARVFGPVGLDLGADGPRQVAISIVAELLAFISGREPRHLAERREAIHPV